MVVSSRQWVQKQRKIFFFFLPKVLREKRGTVSNEVSRDNGNNKDILVVVSLRLLQGRLWL